MAPNTENRDLQVLPDGQKLVALLADIFTDSFMAENTRFETFVGFRYSSAVILNWEADTLIFSQTLLDSFVRESTDFSSWDEMVHRATDLRFRQ